MLVHMGREVKISSSDLGKSCMEATAMRSDQGFLVKSLISLLPWEEVFFWGRKPLPGMGDVLPQTR